MKVVKNSVVTLNYRVTTPEGAEVDDGKEALVYLHGGHDDLFPKLEEALDGKSINDTVTVQLHADEAFGEYDAELVHTEHRSGLPGPYPVRTKGKAAPRLALRNRIGRSLPTGNASHRTGECPVLPRSIGGRSRECATSLRIAPITKNLAGTVTYNDAGEFLLEIEVIPGTPRAAPLA